MRKYVLATALFCFLSVSSQVRAGEVPVPQGDGRAEVIENELQKASGWAQRHSEDQTQEKWQERQTDVSEGIDEVRDKFESDPTMGAMSDEHLQERAIVTDDVTQDIKKKFTDDNVLIMEKEQPKNFSSFEEDEAAFEDHVSGKHEFELGPEMYSYKYTENIGVKLTGVKGGMAGAYQYRLSDNERINSWGDFLNDNTRPNIFRLEGRASYGKVDYEGSGTWGGIPDWNFETRGIIGMELPVREAFVFTPYAGFGYRYLMNKLSKYPAGFVGSQEYLSGYDRESNYLYIPLGLEAKTNFERQWSLAVKGEFDIFVWGKQISHLENSVNLNDTNAGYDKLANTQKGGLGWRFSVRLTKESGRVDLFAEPFIRYWHIEDSEVELVTSGGAAICQGNLCAAGLEPDNKTWEYGLNLGAKF